MVSTPGLVPSGVVVGTTLGVTFGVVVPSGPGRVVVSIGPGSVVVSIGVPGVVDTTGTGVDVTYGVVVDSSFKQPIKPTCILIRTWKSITTTRIPVVSKSNESGILK